MSEGLRELVGFGVGRAVRADDEKFHAALYSNIMADWSAAIIARRLIV